MFRQLNKSAIW